MKESEKILLKDLLARVNHELTLALANPTTLEANTADYNALANKITSWKTMLYAIVCKINASMAYQELRAKNVKGLPPEVRYREKQSIDSNQQSIRELKTKVREVNAALLRLINHVTLPSDFEIMGKVLENLQDLHNWQIDLIKLREAANATHDADAMQMIQEIGQQYKLTPTTKQPLPMLGMVIALIALLSMTQKLIKTR